MAITNQLLAGTGGRANGSKLINDTFMRSDGDVGIVLTGGTIGSVLKGDNVVQIASSPEQQLLKMTESAIKIEQPTRRLSEDFEPNDWVTIAKSVKSLTNRKSVSSVVVLHGTDTLSYTSAALSFLLADIDIPVIITGANRPTSDIHSDAETNYLDAVTASRTLPPGVYVSFSGIPGKPSVVHLGTRVRKAQAAARSFISVGRNPVARIVDGSVIPVSKIPARNPVHGTSLAVCADVMLIKLYPGCPLGAISRLVERESIKGVVVELYASSTGHGGTGELSLIEFTKTCTKNGVVVVGTVNDGVDRVHGVYKSSIQFQEAGGLLASGILPETATVKLMWVLGQRFDEFGIQRAILRDISGEFVASRTA